MPQVGETSHATPQREVLEDEQSSIQQGGSISMNISFVLNAQMHDVHFF